MTDVEAASLEEAVRFTVGTSDEDARMMAAHRGRLEAMASARWPGQVVPRPEIVGWLHNGGGSRQAIVDLVDESWPDGVVEIADQIQDAVSESTAAWGMAFPECPVHRSHPMTPRVVDEVPYWVCPVSPDVSLAIGSVGRAVR